MQNEIHKYHDEWNEPHTKCMLCTSIHIIVKKKKGNLSKVLEGRGTITLCTYQDENRAQRTGMHVGDCKDMNDEDR